MSSLVFVPALARIHRPTPRTMNLRNLIFDLKARFLQFFEMPINEKMRFTFFWTLPENRPKAIISKKSHP